MNENETLLPFPREYRREPRNCAVYLTASKRCFSVTRDMKCAISADISEETLSEMALDFEFYTGRKIEIKKAPGNGGGNFASIGASPQIKPEALALAPEKSGSHAICIGEKNIDMASRTPEGLFWAWQTFCQLAALPSFDTGVITDWSECDLRVMHIDLKGMTPNLETLKRMLRNFSRFKINAVLWEYEDKIKLDSHPVFAHPDLAFSKKEFSELFRLGEARFMRNIPKLQCIGHMDYLLRHPDYKDLREADGRDTYQMCPSTPRSFEVWKEMADELMDLHGGENIFHIGADEVGHDYECSRCGDKDRFKLYVSHLDKVASYLKGRGREVWAWDDVFRNHPIEENIGLLKKITPLVWQYGPVNELFIKRFTEHNVPVVASSAVQCTSPGHFNFTNLESRLENIAHWTDLVERNNIRAHVATAWTRSVSYLPPHNFPETSIFQALFFAETAWNGKVPGMSDFDRRFAKVFWDCEGPAAEALPHMTGVNPQAALEYVNMVCEKAGRNPESLEAWKAACVLDDAERHIKAYYDIGQENINSFRRATTNKIKRILTNEAKAVLKKMDAAAEAYRAIMSKHMRKEQIDEVLEARLWQHKEFIAIVDKAVRDGASFSD